MKKLPLLLIIVFSISFAQTVEYSDEFLKFGASTRSISLGQAVVALPQHVEGYLVNPAATSYLSGIVVTGMFANQMYNNEVVLTKYYSAGIQIPIKSGFQFGIHGVSLGVDNIFERPDLFNVIDVESRRDSIRELYEKGLNPFNTRQSALTFNVSKNISQRIRLPKKSIVPFVIPFGLNVRVLSMDLFNNKGIGIGFDFGTMLKFNFERVNRFKLVDEISFGSAITNLNNTKIYWDSDTNEIIPMEIIYGAGVSRSFKIIPVKLVFIGQSKSRNNKKFQYGSELILLEKISIRFGSEYDTLQGGLGIKFTKPDKKFGIDYSFSNNDLGNSHRFGGWISF